MTKKFLMRLIQTSLMCCLAVILTGCDEFFSMMDNPVTPRLNVRSNSITLKVGETASCEASTQDHVALFYASADPAVATVDAKGIITGVAVGKTKVTVTAKGDDEYYRTQIFGESTQVIDVEVVEAKTKINVESVTLDQPTLDKKVGDAAVTLTATVNPSDADNKTVTWKSSDETVATVADGVVTFVAAGTATITATATNGTAETSDDKEATCAVTVTAAAPSMRSTPFTIEALEDGVSVTFSTSNTDAARPIEYSTDGGATWTAGSTLNPGVSVNLAKAGDKVMFRGNNASYAESSAYNKISSTKNIKVYGNIMSLIQKTGFETLTALTAERTFRGLFNNNVKLTDASGLLLPATSLANYCYIEMFMGCTSLTAAPELKAETLANYCYASMFKNCTSLATAPKLPATTLVYRCYYQMFYCCTALTNAYVKAEYTTANGECSDMFLGTGPTAGTLHTTATNKASWNGVWVNWTAADDWTD